MEVFVQKELKEHNQLLLLRSLSAHLIESTGIVKSTGGRCPLRFALVPNQFVTLCIYVHEGTIDYRIIRLYEKYEIKNV